MTYELCLCGLHPLKEKEQEDGYCPKHSQELFGRKNRVKLLPFTRSEFIRTQPAKQRGMSISGAQPKLSLRRDDAGQLEVTPTSGEYILKPSPEQYPGLAENEHAIMLSMKSLGFDVPHFGLIPFTPEDANISPELAFIISRYDRHSEVKTHQEQLDGAMNISDKYGLNSEGVPAISYERAMRFLLTNIDNSLSVKRDIFKRVVCAYLFGNNDLHLRNLGIIHHTDGKLSVAPVYDYVSVVPYPESFGATLALPLLEREECYESLAAGLESGIGEYIGYDFLEFSAGIGLQPILARKLIADLCNKQELLFEIIQSSYMRQTDKNDVIKYMARRIMLLNMFDSP